MCQGGEADSVNGDLGNNLDTEIKMMGDNNNNNNNHFFNNQNYNVQPFCSCMSGSRRVRKRHPATVQTPGRQLVETEVMEPLVNYLDRLEPAWASNNHNNSARDFNDNFRCDGDGGDGGDGGKGMETQFVMEFSHMRLGGSRRPGTFDESATTQDMKNCRLLSSKLK